MRRLASLPEFLFALAFGLVIYTLATAPALPQQLSDYRGVFCDTAEQAVEIVKRYKGGSVQAATEAYNAEIGVPGACAPVHIIGIVGDVKATSKGPTGTMNIREFLVVGLVDGGVPVQMTEPKTWYGLEKIAEPDTPA